MEIFSKLGFDFTSIVLYLINFGLLFLILSRLLYPKILHFLDERKKMITSNIEESNRLKESFEKKLKEIQLEQENTRKMMEQEIRDTKKLLQKEKNRLLKEMEDERNKMLEQTQIQIDKKKEKLLKEAESELLVFLKKSLIYITRNKMPSRFLEENVDEAWSLYSKK